MSNTAESITIKKCSKKMPQALPSVEEDGKKKERKKGPGAKRSATRGSAAPAYTPTL